MLRRLVADTRMSLGSDVAAHNAIVFNEGRKTATIVEFFDYTCTYCRQGAGSVVSLARTHDVGLLFRLTPRPGDKEARLAALAAACAYDQGRFREMHTELLRSGPRYDRTSILLLLRDANIPDSATFDTCVSSSSHPRLLADSLLAHRLFVRETPSFAIAGKPMIRGSKLEVLQRAIR